MNTALAPANACTGRQPPAAALAFVPFRPHHLATLRLQAAQTYLQPLMTDAQYAAALTGPHAWSGVLAGRIIGCAGIVPQWPGRAVAWALLTRELSAAHFLRAHHKVAAVLHAAHRDGHRRIETTVDAGFDAGHRWVRALGFAPEGLMRAYSPEGRDHVLYARVAPPELVAITPADALVGGRQGWEQGVLA